MVKKSNRFTIKEFLILLAQKYPDRISKKEIDKKFPLKSFFQKDIEELKKQKIIDVEEWPILESFFQGKITTQQVYRLSPIKGWNYIFTLETNKLNKQMICLTRVLIFLGIGTFILALISIFIKFLRIH